MTTNDVLHIKSTGGSFEGRLFHPQAEPAPGVLIVPEMYGLNAYIESVAREYAAHGFLTLVMDVLWRVVPGLILSYVGPDNARAHAIHDAFDFEAGAADMQAAIDALRALPQCSGKVGVVGFCLGGTMAYVAAQQTTADAAVDYYGSRAVEFFAEAAKLTTPVMLHTGAEDKAFPSDGFEQIATAAAAAHGKIISHVYPGARHAFANNVRADRYHAEASTTALERTFAFFDANLR
jgi:carboxymethylenebutenolidase